MKCESVGDEESVRAAGGDAAVQVMMHAREVDCYNCYLSSLLYLHSL